MDITLDQAPAAQEATNIDKEHQVQLGMLDAFCSLVENGEAQPRIQEMLDQLISYSEIHFMSEQLLMRNYAYPDFDDHVNDHETMVEHLNKIKDSYIAGKKSMVLETAQEMRNFLIGHINSRDQAFTDYLSNMKSSL